MSKSRITFEMTKDSRTINVILSGKVVGHMTTHGDWVSVEMDTHTFYEERAIQHDRGLHDTSYWLWKEDKIRGKDPTKEPPKEGKVMTVEGNADAFRVYAGDGDNEAVWYGSAEFRDAVLKELSRGEVSCDSSYGWEGPKWNEECKRSVRGAVNITKLSPVLKNEKKQNR
jgi:hypothetical protein